jgi:TPR repeat protein
MNNRLYWNIRTRALNGHSESAWILGEAFLDGFGWNSCGERFQVRRNRKTAVRWLHYASVLKNPDAMVSLAMQIAITNQVEDIRKALAWEKCAYRLGNRFVAYNIALSYAMLECPKDCFRWLRKGRLSETRLALAYCYAFGYGTRKNVQKAKSLLQPLARDVIGDQPERKCAQNFLHILNTTHVCHLRPPQNSSPAFPLGKRGRNEATHLFHQRCQ